MGVITQNGQVVITNGSILTYEGSGGGGASVGESIAEGDGSDTIVFSDLEGEPVLGAIMVEDAISASGLAFLYFDNIPTAYGYSVNSGTIDSTTEADWTYENGTLTLTLNGGIFDSMNYVLAYAYTGAASTYSVTITLTNPVYPSDFGSFDIYTCDGENEGAYIGSITSPTGSTTVTVETTDYGIAIWAINRGYDIATLYGVTSCTGGVTFEGGSTMGFFKFHVTGDGTITCNGVDWEYD